MEQRIYYQPYKLNARVIPVVIFLDIVLVFLSGVNLCINNILGFVTCLLMGALCLCSTIVLNDSIKVVMVFDSNGFFLINSIYKQCRYVKWEDYKYVYSYRSFKAHEYLVLSPEIISAKKRKNIVRKILFSYKPFVDEAIVIYRNTSKKAYWVVELIKDNIGVPQEI